MLFHIGFGVFGVILTAPLAWGDPRLQDVCGPSGHSTVQGSVLTERSCQAAYVSANGWVISDNNSRVQASVAVVCAYSCMTPMGSSCSGGGSGSACSAAYGAAQKSNDYGDSSDSFYEAAQKNGSTALALQLGSASAFSDPPGGGKAGGTTEAAGPSSLPESCRMAGVTGNVADRINCAAATDPALPGFVKDPKFLQDFQNITGQPLQAVINKSEETLLQDYAPGALRNAYEGVKGSDLSFADFSNKAASFFKNIKDSFSDRGNRVEDVERKPSQNPLPNPVEGGAPTLEGPSLNSVKGMDSPKNHRELSLFERISLRHRAFATWLTEQR